MIDIIDALAYWIGYFVIAGAVVAALGFVIVSLIEVWDKVDIKEFDEQNLFIQNRLSMIDRQLKDWLSELDMPEKKRPRKSKSRS